MSEYTDFYLSWSGCAAFGAAGSSQLTIPTPVVFSPTDLSGCQIWFDANNSGSITTDVDNTSILTWQNLGDLSANMIPYNGTGSYNVDTINGLNVVRFGASNNMYVYGELPNEHKTAFVVFKGLNDLSGASFPFLNLFNAEASNGFQFGASYYEALGGYIYTACQNGIWCNYGTGPNSYNTTTMAACRVDVDISNNFISVNKANLPGDNVNSASGFNQFPIPYVVGRNDGSSMDCAEIIVYTRALSDSEVAQVYTYLTTRWGI